ncbi:hypothetical protein BCR33DRAFT_784172 [Rhizoclosmatium globosum]|uniref:Activator of Hsp90 ATPase AHSA1-like N-terminal domain-containing protein n=1 Tax=Rhizoclosmatium globosum TaxID=329046 RepID=A0A1Y2CG69_9FUNG|nr:hypothetical protein BCR33DRAFT_784172 [Rhizoclosmatium globosum]|eukprot:ORY46063.1 hypothetical protein BCR33DRAFT_784172 [Rhizoclosmatium globosum]
MAATTTTNQTNWKNVGNWHWVEKNCMPWAKEYVSTQLTGVVVEQNGTKVETTEVTGFAGDADINQRKGKLITVYDVNFNVNWKATNAEGKQVSGRINVPEFMHDTDADDLVVEVTTNTQDAESEAARSIVIKSLVPLLKQKLENFQNGKDVHISKDEMVGHPTGTTYKPNHLLQMPKKLPKLLLQSIIRCGGLSTITMNTEFVCSAADLYNSFLDQGRVQAWSRGPAQIKPEVGAEISLFGGNVTGKILELVPNQKFQSLQYCDSLFEEQRESVNLRLTQTEVPIGEKDLTTKNWTGYYFNGIKTAFGFGAVGF